VDFVYRLPISRFHYLEWLTGLRSHHRHLLLQMKPNREFVLNIAWKSLTIWWTRQTKTLPEGWELYYHPKTKFRYFFHHPSRTLTNLDLLDASLSEPAESVYTVATDMTVSIPEGWEQVFNPSVGGWEEKNRLRAVWKPGRFFVDHNSRTLTPTDPRTAMTMLLNREWLQPWRGG
jgi:hypothetical protein